MKTFAVSVHIINHFIGECTGSAFAVNCGKIFLHNYCRFFYLYS